MNLRCRLAGGGIKPPKDALVKSLGFWSPNFPDGTTSNALKAYSRKRSGNGTYRFDKRRNKFDSL